MVWFQCDDCGDSVKKPKVQGHFGQCAARSFTCIDCSRHFDRNTYKAHNACVTEHEKYAKGATKPGGHAANGFFSTDAAGVGTRTAGLAEDATVGAEFLSMRPPWKCSICNVSATSQETLQGHAAGMKHKRRVKAVTKAAQPVGEQPAGTAASPAVGVDAVSSPMEAAKGSSANGATAHGAAAFGGANGVVANDLRTDGADTYAGDTTAHERKRPQEAPGAPEEAAGVAANGTAATERAADKPRKKIKGKAAVAAAPTAVTGGDSAQPGQKRKREREPGLPAESQPAADSVSTDAADDSKQQPPEKPRKKGKKGAQQAMPMAEDAAPAMVAELITGRARKQNGAAPRVKIVKKGSQQRFDGADNAPMAVIESADVASAQDGPDGGRHENGTAAGQTVTTGQTAPSSELRKLRKERKAAQAEARVSEGGGAGQWEAAAVQRLRELGSGGELPLKRLLRDLVKAARKAMRQQWDGSSQLVISEGMIRLAN